MLTAWALAIVDVAGADSSQRASKSANRWVATWATAPQALGPPGTPRAAGLENETVRNIVHTSVGGPAVRLRLTNRLGTRPVTFDAVRVGLQQEGAVIVPGSNRVVTFGRQDAGHDP